MKGRASWSQRVSHDSENPRRIDFHPEFGAGDWLGLIDAELDAQLELPTTSLDRRLCFTNNPSATGAYELGSTQVLGPNLGPYALSLDRPANRAFLHAESRVFELYRSLQTFQPSEEVLNVLEKALDVLGRLDREKEMHWSQQRIQSPSDKVVYNTERFFRNTLPKDPTILAASVLSLLLHNKYFAPRRATQAHLSGVHDILLSTDPYKGDSKAVFNVLPKDPRTLSSRFLLDPTTTTYICCPECHKLYHFIPDDPTANPKICDYRKTPASESCGAKLWKERDYGPYGIRSSPVKKYVHQDLKSWLGRLLSRPGIEDLLEKRAVNTDGEVDDIWGGEVLRNFKDRAGNPYYPGPDDELRLAFSLSVDGFDPYQNKVAKQSAASTGIWMVLLNLPPHLRYLE
ncbi:hypothetical protein EST38_g14515, partial [Candolleomyces aberdarensis]